jgi:hypothetical protein
MKKKELLFYLLNITIPLLIGTYIYIRYSPDVIFVGYLNNFIELKAKELNSVTLFLRNYLCDFCWSYSLAFSISFIYYENFSLVHSILIPATIGIAIELLQLIGLIDGTYDLFDIFVELLATLLCFMILKIRNDEEAKL